MHRRQRENVVLLDLAQLAVGKRLDAQGSDQEQIEGCGPNHGTGAEVARVEARTARLDDRQQDLGGRGAEGHEGQICDRGVPDFGLDLGVDRRAGRVHLFVPGPVIHRHLFLLHLRRDGLDAVHECIAQHAHAEEHPEEPHQIDKCAEAAVPAVLARDHREDEGSLAVEAARPEGLGPRAVARLHLLGLEHLAVHPVAQVPHAVGVHPL
mmetsp:Transcript_335/g.897  ORF Transcript_335/g.897 Transcript_335/m.897 type:complete len:209 (-) Transcript_335:241-867(-)